MMALWTVLRRGFALLWRYRWTFAVPVATLLLPATIMAVRLPDLYEAEAVVQVRPLYPETIGRALPEAGTVRADQMMSTVRERLFARKNLQAVRDILRPGNEGDEAGTLEGLAGSFAYDRVGATAFRLSVQDPNPVSAAKAVNTLLESFLEGERGGRLQRAERNQEFHSAELAAAQDAFGGIRDRLRSFRIAHAESLPDRKDAIESEIERLRTVLTSQEGLAASARTRVQMYEDQLLGLATESSAAESSRMSAVEESLSIQLGEAKRALGALERELAEASAGKTDRHPTVIRLREAVAIHRQTVSQTLVDLDKVRQADRARANESASARLARKSKILNGLKATAAVSLTQAENAIRQHSEREVVLGLRLSEIPNTAAALQPLLREEDQALQRLQAAQDAASAARAAAEYYRRAGTSEVTGFQVDAWAMVPGLPTGSGRMRYLLTAIGLGLLAGYGLMLLRRRHEGAIVSRPLDLEGLCPAAIVVGVPRLGSGRRRSWGARAREIGTAAYALGLLAATLYLLAIHKGWVAGPEWVHGLIWGGKA